MCYAYKKQRSVICFLNKSPNLIDRKKTVQVQKAPRTQMKFRWKKVLTEFMHTKILRNRFYCI